MGGTKDQIPAIYARAIKKYQEITDETLDVDFLRKLQNVDDLTKEIDARNQQFGEFREKRGVIFDVMKAALIPVQLFGDLAAGGASMVFPPSSLIFGAVTYLMGAAKGVSASYNAIHELMGSLKDFTIRLKAYSRESISEDLSEKLSDILVTLIEVFALSTKTIRRGRLLKFARNFALGSDDAIQAALGKLDKLTQVEAHLVGAETLTESKRTGRVVDDISVTVNAASATVTETGITVNSMSVRVDQVQEMIGNLMVTVDEEKQGTREERERSQQLLVHKILSPSKADSAQDWYDKINKARIPGTGDWIRNEDVFTSWLDKESPVMFISGNPGAGKSYLSANIITFLKEKYPRGQETSQTSIGYFFFKDDNPNTRSFHQALLDLAFQISKSDPVYHKYLATIESHERVSTLESAWRLLFVDFFLKKRNADSTVYILFDALDEAFDEERRDFLSLAKDLYEYPDQRHLQLAFVARPHVADQLIEGLEVEVPTIHITTQKNSHDINSYITASIKKSAVLRRVSAKLRKEIIEKLSAGAEGMFLWANLMLQELVKKRSEGSMRKALEHPPKGLKEMLRQVLSTFSATGNEEELEYLNEILAWVACSTEPLTLGGVESILKLKSPEGDGMIYLEGALRRQWASFFILDREDGLNTAELQTISSKGNTSDGSDEEEEQDDEEAFEDVENLTDFNSHAESTTVTFCHASIGDFFRDETEGKVSANGSFAVGVNHLEAKTHVLKTLIKVLSDKTFAEKADDKGAMLNHASTHWIHFLKQVSPSDCSLEDRTEIAQVLLRLFTDEESIIAHIGRRSWVSTKANLEAVRKWWKDSEVIASLPEEGQDFIKSTESDPITTFKPIMMLCVDKWVRGNQWNVPPCAGMIWSYQRLQKDTEIPDLSNFNPTAEELIEAASFGDFAKDGLWHRRTAIALRSAKHHDVSIEYFTKALELDPDDYLVRAGLSLAYVAKKDWSKAIELDEEAAKMLSAKIESDPENRVLQLTLHSILERLALSYNAADEPGKRLETLQRSYKAIEYCSTCLNELLDYYGSKKDHKEVMALIQQLADTPFPEKDYTCLTKALCDNPYNYDDFFVHVADAALATDSLDFLTGAFRTAAKEARKVLRTLTAANLELSLARLYSEYLGDQDKAIKRWEKILSMYASSNEDTEIGGVKLEAAYSLTQRLLCNAVDAGFNTPEAEAVVTKLEALAKRTVTNTQSDAWILDGAREISLGAYYRLSGRDADAKRQFRPSISRALQILSDDDPENDEEGLDELVNVLVAAGDTTNVIAVAYMLAAAGEDGEDDENNEDGDDEPEDTWFCDGPCRKGHATLEDFSMCPICFNTAFCQDCTKLLETGEVPTKTCSAKHAPHFIHIPTRPTAIEKGKVLVDGEIVEFEAWKEQLRKKWDL
ncbi:NACHT and TPR domain protein [Aspergillus karnatakaensis]|uniref:NACHT and TPR domain protein n=1 Tax=Aspergillus karnatakaensis TaxID=1810916 RepID=UPI003CCE42EE